MTRNRVKMTFIENEISRKATFRKRKGGIMKKALELSTLCDVPVAVFVQSEYNSAPQTFPASREDVAKIVAKWDSLSLVDKTRKMVNQETFLKQRIAKETERCKKWKRENVELALKKVMFDCLSGKTAPCFLNQNELRGVGDVVDQYIKLVDRRIRVLANNNDASSPSTAVVPAAAAVATFVAMPRAEMGFSSTGFNDTVQENMNVTRNVRDFDLNVTQSE